MSLLISKAKRVLKKAKTSSKSNSFRKSELELLLPNKMYFIKEESLRIYKSSIVSNIKNRHLYDIAIESHKEPLSYPYIDQQREIIEIDPLKLGDYFNVFIADNDLENYLGSEVDVIIKSATTEIMNKKPIISMFGDSTTQRYLPTVIKNELERYVQPTFMGTTQDDGNIDCEARGGWMFSQYIGYRTVNKNGVKMADFPNFLKLASEEDKMKHPDWCFTRTFSKKEKNYTEVSDKTQDFYIFDFAHYLSINGYENPDVLTLSMGTNDLGVYGDTGVGVCKLAAEIIINQVLKASPETKICLIPLPVSAGDSIVKRRINWIKECINSIEPKYDNVDVVCEYAHQSKEFSWDLKRSQNKGRMDISYLINDRIHTSRHGTAEGAKPIVHYILNQI